MKSRVPPLRVRAVNQKLVSNEGRYVIYWMSAYRRLHYNFALERAIEWALHLDQPLVVLDALRVGYEWASDRFHRFVLDGIADNHAALLHTDVYHFPYIEREKGQGKGLLATLASRASVVVTDDFPCFFLPRAIESAAKQVPVLLEAVDSNGLLPMHAAPHAFGRAFDFRRYLQKSLLPHLDQAPLADPLKDVPLPRMGANDLPADFHARWPKTHALSSSELAALPIDHKVAPVFYTGGERRGRETMHDFLDNRLDQYLMRNHPDENGASRLSPYLHFGHVSVHEVFHELAADEGWSKERVAARTTGQAKGFWGMSEAAESFFDELVTWRELGFNYCSHRHDYDQLASLPDWAKQTMAKHASDVRPYVYTLAEFENARTHDPLWNAAQTELVRDGRIHNYLRMLWGKKIYEWSRTAEDALAVLIHLNNKYAVDGRNPNSYSGIFWVLGRYDRPWPERAIYGTLRSMSSDSTRKKVELTEYLKQYGA